ncbi:MULTISPECIES: hypothetical protein [Bacillus]|uniref:hypothetical protein n=1 Tax=Bacillus TaxID=1386 RepID=UPI00273D6FDA|nr:hypothetical protein [Bacillus sp. MMSF_3328]
MKAIQMNTLNAGSGCMVLQINVQYGGKLKTIVVSEDSIVGFSLPDPFNYEGDLIDILLWETTDWDQLEDFIGIEMTLKIFQKVSDEKWFKDSLRRGRLTARLKLREFIQAASELQDNWDEVLNEGYPFQDFEEHCLELMDWQNAVMRQTPLTQELKKVWESNKQESLFQFNGIEITNPFLDETGTYKIAPIDYYGYENIQKAYNQLKNIGLSEVI